MAEHNTKRASATLFVCAALLSACLAPTAHAQGSAAGYPARPLRMMIGFGPGGATDLLSRLLAQKLSERLGQTVVPELRSGAAGAIAADAVAKAPPDGHTLILLTGAHPVVGAMMTKLAYHPLRDFAMVSTIVTYPGVLVVNADSPYRNIGELIAAAKLSPGKISFASVGIGSGQHLIGEWIADEAGIELLHVPFRGGPAGLTELLAGRVDMMIDILTSALPQIRAGKTRALALTTRDGSRFLPDVPSIARTLPNVHFASWNGVATTAGTPPPVIERLTREIHAILQMPEIQKQLTDLGGEPSPSSPAAMARLVNDEMARWNKIIDSRRIERQ